MNPISEDDLQAFVDDRLPAARRREVADWLAGHPAEAARLQAYGEQDRALRELYGPWLDEPLPDSLRRLAEPPADLAGRRGWQVLPDFAQRLAAGVLIAVIAGGAGWFGRGLQPEAAPLAQIPLSRQAAVAHAVYSPDLRRPVEIAADQEEQLVRWLSKRLGQALIVPKLGMLGYELVGGRLLPGGQGPVAQFMYEESSGQRLTLYVSTENALSGDAGFRFAQEGEVNVFYWIDGRFAYALSASIGRDELATIARAVYDQLEPK
jgi:anti-sigma factor RsiW